MAAVGGSESSAIAGRVPLSGVIEEAEAKVPLMRALLAGGQGKRQLVDIRLRHSLRSTKPQARAFLFHPHVNPGRNVWYTGLLEAFSETRKTTAGFGVPAK
ncbi:hypothetical protein D7M11_19765 [Paenibacillus ginsengarvi]|uniref:Uncharacterized protein n=1 Tax=Paenibacillus ginsengarvi TaxID=400777 RepID=A0A3B0C535_9BACL|nr:hypothetical protein D7M11_19765 [Paenibacillus ginsengarvi]